MDKFLHVFIKTDVQISHIVSILQTDYRFLKECWRVVARLLDLSLPEICQVDAHLSKGECTIGLWKMLDFWVSRSGQKAKLSVLLDALTAEKLINLKEQIALLGNGNVVPAPFRPFMNNPGSQHPQEFNNEATAIDYLTSQMNKMMTTTTDDLTDPNLNPETTIVFQNIQELGTDEDIAEDILYKKHQLYTVKMVKVARIGKPKKANHNPFSFGKKGKHQREPPRPLAVTVAPVGVMPPQDKKTAIFVQWVVDTLSESSILGSAGVRVAKYFKKKCPINMDKYEKLKYPNGPVQGADSKNSKNLVQRDHSNIMTPLTPTNCNSAQFDFYQNRMPPEHTFSGYARHPNPSMYHQQTVNINNMVYAQGNPNPVYAAGHENPYTKQRNKGTNVASPHVSIPMQTYPPIQNHETRDRGTATFDNFEYGYSTTPQKMWNSYWDQSTQMYRQGPSYYGSYDLNNNHHT